MNPELCVCVCVCDQMRQGRDWVIAVVVPLPIADASHSKTCRAQAMLPASRVTKYTAPLLHQLTIRLGRHFSKLRLQHGVTGQLPRARGPCLH
jgi:hypothetical protein